MNKMPRQLTEVKLQTTCKINVCSGAVEPFFLNSKTGRQAKPHNSHKLSLGRPPPPSPHPFLHTSLPHGLLTTHHPGRGSETGCWALDQSGVQRNFRQTHASKQHTLLHCGVGVCVRVGGVEVGGLLVCPKCKHTNACVMTSGTTTR